MKYKEITCPFCTNGTAHITYEEKHVYQLRCEQCNTTLLKEDYSWDSAVEYFDTMQILHTSKTDYHPCRDCGVGWGTANADSGITTCEETCERYARYCKSLLEER